MLVCFTIYVIQTDYYF